GPLLRVDGCCYSMISLRSNKVGLPMESASYQLSPIQLGSITWTGSPSRKGWADEKSVDRRCGYSLSLSCKGICRRGGRPSSSQRRIYHGDPCGAVGRI